MHILQTSRLSGICLNGTNERKNELELLQPKNRIKIYATSVVYSTFIESITNRNAKTKTNKKIWLHAHKSPLIDLRIRSERPLIALVHGHILTNAAAKLNWNVILYAVWMQAVNELQRRSQFLLLLFHLIVNAIYFEDFLLVFFQFYFSGTLWCGTKV